MKIQNNANQTDAGGGKDIYEWLRPLSYQVPSWAQKQRRRATYRGHVIGDLRDKYMAAETEFLVTYKLQDQPDPDERGVFSDRIAELLRQARDELEKDHPNEYAASNLLGLIEENMVWLYKPIVLINAIAPIVRSRLRCSNLSNKDDLTQIVNNTLEEVKEYLENETPKEAKKEDAKRPVVASKEEEISNEEMSLWTILSGAIRNLNNEEYNSRLDKGNQLSWLKKLLLLGTISLLVLWLFSPFAINWSGLSIDEHLLLSAQFPNPDYLLGLLLAFTVISFGAGGGFLSGLLEARSLKISFSDLAENFWKLLLKPVVGALFAVVLFVLLGWEILEGVRLENVGSYLLIAFLSGFSERYFLRLLPLDAGKGEELKSEGAKTPDVSQRAG